MNEATFFSSNFFWALSFRSLTNLQEKKWDFHYSSHCNFSKQYRILLLHIWMIRALIPQAAGALKSYVLFFPPFSHGCSPCYWWGETIILAKTETGAMPMAQKKCFN